MLAAYSDPEASWPVAIQVVAGLVAFGTWRYVNRRNNRPFAVVLLALGILTVLILASASYAACPDDDLSQGWSVVTRVVGLLTNNYAVDMFEEPGCQTNGVPLALQFARLAQLIVLLVAATSAVTALLRTQVDRVAVRWAPRAVGGARGRRHVGAAAAGPGLRRRAVHARGLHLRPPGALGGTGPCSRVAGRHHRPQPPGVADPPARAARSPARAAPAGRAGAGQHRGAAADDRGPGGDRGPQDGHRQPPGAGAAAHGRGVAGRGLAAPLPEPDPRVDRGHDQRERGHRPAPRRPHGRAPGRPRAAGRSVRPHLRGGRRAGAARPGARADARAGVDPLRHGGRSRQPTTCSRSTSSPSAGSATPGSTGCAPRSAASSTRSCRTRSPSTRRPPSCSAAT